LKRCFKNITLIKYLSLIVFFGFIGCFSKILEPSVQSERKRPLNAEPGKCYAQHFEKQFSIDTLLEYTGENFDQTGIEKREIKVSPGSTKWETKVDPNCKSPNPNDCKIRCLVEVPPKYEEFYVVTDTSFVKNYRSKVIEIEQFGKTDSKWFEVICESQLTNNFFKKLQDKLLEINYLNTNKSSFSRTELNDALDRYQIDNNLPNGKFFVETLKHIGL